MKAWETLKLYLEMHKMVREGKVPDPESIPESPIHQVPISLTFTLPSGKQITKTFFGVRPYCPICLEAIPNPGVRSPEAKQIYDIVWPWLFDTEDGEAILKDQVQLPVEKVSGVPKEALEKYGEIKGSNYILTRTSNLVHDAAFPFHERFYCECGTTTYTFVVCEEDLIEIFPPDVIVDSRLWSIFPLDLEHWIMYTHELYHVAPADHYIAFRYTGPQQIRIYGLDGESFRIHGLRPQEIFEEFLDRSLPQILEDPRVPPIHSRKNISVRVKTMEQAHKLYMIRKIAGERSLGKLFRGYLVCQYPELLNQ